MTGPTLVLRLAGPLQSWGTTSKHNRRDTGTEPSKSGIVGLLAAAQGRRRTEPVEDLAGLRLGVRVDRPGQLRRDYHTVSRLDGSPLPSTEVDRSGKQRLTKWPTRQTYRFYLEEAVFVAALSGSEELLSTLVDALLSPAYPLALGRRSCPPTQPLLLPAAAEDPLHGTDVLEALQRVPWQVSPSARRDGRAVPPRVDLPVVVDDPDGDDVRDDLPLSFDPLLRRYGSRRVSQHWVSVTTGEPAAEADSGTGGTGGDVEHDPFALLGW